MADCARLLVIGVGNALRGDDAAGVLVARAVRRPLAGVAEVLESDGDGTLLVQTVQGRPRVIVVDGVRSGASPGTVHRFDAAVTPLPAGRFVCSTHAFGLAEGIELARALGVLPASLVLYGIELESVETGAGPTPAVAAAIEEAAERVIAEACADRTASGASSNVGATHA